MGDLVTKESVLFLRDATSNEARGSLLFPIQRIISMSSSSGEISYENKTVYRFASRSRDVVTPAGSRFVTRASSDLRCPTNSQEHQLTHRDGGGEIIFGAKLEYHHLQTYVTYQKANNDWNLPMPAFDARALPNTLQKLRDRKELSNSLLGDSISTGCNAFVWREGAP